MYAKARQAFDHFAIGSGTISPIDVQRRRSSKRLIYVIVQRRCRS